MKGPVVEVSYSGSKPIPGYVHMEGWGGCTTAFDPHDVVRDGGKGATHPFTREFQHPTDRW